MKRIISFMLIVSFILLLIPTAVLATEDSIYIEFDAKLIQTGSENPPQTLPNTGLRLFSTADYEGAYLALYEGMKNRQAAINVEQYNIPFDPQEPSNIIDLYSKAVNDHGDLFYVGASFGISATLENKLFEYRPQYVAGITQTEIDMFNEKVEYILSKATGANMSDEDKVLAIHDYLINNCEYDYSSTIPHLSFTAYGAIVNEIAVCQGYSIAMNYLLKKLGVPCLYVTSDPMNHGWSMVMLGGQWYHVDPTWNDTSTALHYYFLLTDDTMSIRGHYDWDTTLPECTSTMYETGYPFHSYNTIFHYRNGWFWFRSGSTYYKTDFDGTNKVTVSAQNYIINPTKAYTIYYPIVYNAQGNVLITSLSNLGDAKIAIERHQTVGVQETFFVAYYDASNTLLQLSKQQIEVNAEGFDVVTLSEQMPAQANSAKIFLWDVAGLSELSSAYVQ